MTSATGSESTSRGRGFTLIEMLVVISILVLLFGLFLGAAMRLVGQARKRATVALLHKLNLQIEEYRDTTGSYPPDGLDPEEPVVDAQTGTALYATASIYRSLTEPLEMIRQGPGGQRGMQEVVLPPIVEKFQSDHLIRSTEYPGLYEIADGFGTPMHYDRLQGAKSFSPQDKGLVHLDPPLWHPPDPRGVDPSTIPEPPVTEMGPQHPGRYDLWSHGPHGHSDPDRWHDAYLGETLGNWNVEGLR